MADNPVASSSKASSSPPPPSAPPRPPPPPPTTTSNSSQDDLDSDDDDLLEDLEDELDNDFDLGGFRERRMDELRAQVDKARLMKENNYGKYTEVKSEKDLIAMTAKAPRSVLHFFHRDFRRCKIMDAHLEKLASKHFDTLFLRAEVSNVPFLVTKMEIQVLPCVVGFVDGKSKMKIVGFDELDGGDSFNTASLELLMIQCEVLNQNPGTGAGLQRALGGVGLGATSRARAPAPARGIRRGGAADDSDSD